MKILIAEDDVVSAKVIARELQKLGHDVRQTKDGLEAWNVIQEEHYPLVVTDWMMPGMEGIELCRRIRSLWNRGYVYIIMLTAKGDKEDQSEAMRAGADDFLSKPLNRADLIARLTATHIHGITPEISRSEIGQAAVPRLLELLRDPDFPRRDNLVAHLGHLGGPGIRGDQQCDGRRKHEPDTRHRNRALDQQPPSNDDGQAGAEHRYRNDGGEQPAHVAASCSLPD